MTEALLDLPPDVRLRLAAALDSELLGKPYTPFGLQAVLGNCPQPALVAAALEELEGMGIAGPAAAAWMRSIGVALTRRPMPDLVWSGPEVPGLHARKTQQVYEELLGSAERTVWASTYAFFDGPKAFKVMADRMDAQPGLKVTLLLNIQRKAGDTSVPDQIVQRFARHFWTHDWPGEVRPDVFYDRRSLEANKPGGVLHAKAVVADDQSLFITSANFTEAALGHNIELGVVLRDRALAISVSRHFARLIEEKLLSPLPSS